MTNKKRTVKDIEILACKRKLRLNFVRPNDSMKRKCYFFMAVRKKGSKCAWCIYSANCIKIAMLRLF